MTNVLRKFSVKAFIVCVGEFALIFLFYSLFYSDTIICQVLPKFLTPRKCLWILYAEKNPSENTHKNALPIKKINTNRMLRMTESRMNVRIKHSNVTCVWVITQLWEISNI